MSLFATAWCKSIVFNPLSIDFEAPKLEFGPWYVSKMLVDETDGEVTVREVCEMYPDGSNIDVNWILARSFALLAPLFGLVVTIALLFAPCDAPQLKRRDRWGALAIFTLAVLPLFQGLNFLILVSNACENNPVVNAVELLLGEEEEQAATAISVYTDSCSLGPGSVMSAIACVSWFLTGLYMLWVGPPSPNGMTRFEARTIKYRIGNSDDDHWARSDVGA